MTAKINPEDINWTDAKFHAERLLRTINDAGWTAPECMQPVLNRCAYEVSCIASALKLIRNTPEAP